MWTQYTALGSNVFVTHFIHVQISIQHQHLKCVETKRFNGNFFHSFCINMDHLIIHISCQTKIVWFTLNFVSHSAIVTLSGEKQQLTWEPDVNSYFFLLSVSIGGHKNAKKFYRSWTRFASMDEPIFV